jgi:hypothetical protein
MEKMVTQTQEESFFDGVTANIQRVLSRRQNQPPVTPKGFLPISKSDPKDIFIVAYPKSGITWFQELIAAVLYGVSPEFCPARLVSDLIPDVHLKQVYQRYQTPMFFKSHHLPRPEYRRVIYIMRDGRDVMTSYYHYLQALTGNSMDFLKMVGCGGQLYPCQWHEHVKAWRENRFRAAILTVKYEDLHADILGEMRRVCEFVGIERNPEHILRFARETEFEKMQRKEARLQDYLNPLWPRQKRFRRRGKVGSFKDEMPPPVLEACLAASGPMLQICGYI